MERIIYCTNIGCSHRAPSESPDGRCVRHLGPREDGLGTFEDSELAQLLQGQANSGSIVLSDCSLTKSELDLIGAIATVNGNGDQFSRTTLELRNVEFLGSDAREAHATGPITWPSELNMRFESVTLTSPLVRHRAFFRDVTFTPGSNLRGGHFLEEVEFKDCTLDSVTVDAVTFAKGAILSGCTLRAFELSGCTFLENLTLDGCVLEKRSKTSDVNQILGDLKICSLTATDDTFLSLLECKNLLLDDVTTGKRFRFSALVEETAYVLSANFGEDTELANIKAGGLLSVAGCTFSDRARLNLETASDHIALLDATLGKMSHISASGPMVDLTKCDFTGGGSVELSCGNTRIDRLRSDKPLAVRSSAEDTDGKQASITRIRDVSAENLTLVDIDLSSCSLDGVWNLEKLRFEGQVNFAQAPQRGMTKRRCLSDEVLWRHDHQYWVRGLIPLSRKGCHHDKGRVSARKLQNQYRALRKGLEDSGDQPSASSFYYGEMEMRRKSTRSRAEASLLFAYWFVSGYGLRASRSLSFLALILFITSLLFWRYGFAPSQIQAYFISPTATGNAVLPRTLTGPPPGLIDSAAFTIRTSTSLTRPGSVPPLTISGQILEVTVRILGPVLIALSALAIRGKVKRA